MLIALLRKETEGLLPYWLAFAVLAAVNLLSGLWDPSFVLDPLGERFSGGVGNAGTLWILSFLVGQGSVAHELREGHVEFLDALPVSRAAVFAAKVGAGVVPVVALVVASLAMDLSLVAAIRPPEALSPVQAVLLMHTIMLAAGISGLGLGMALSWIGPLAWGVIGLVLLLALCSGVFYPPSADWLPMLGRFGELGWDGSRATHRVAPPVVLALIGVLGVSVSGALFLGPGRALTERGSSAIAAFRWSLVGCLALAVAPIALAAVAIVLLGHGGTLLAGKRAMPSAEGGFRVLYAPGGEARAEQVAAQVDAVSADVGRRLGQTAPLRLDVELLGAPANHLGVFTGGKIRLATSADDATLAHELAHAHAFAASGPGARVHADATHFFDEGLADWVQAAWSGEPAVPGLAGLIDETGQARFEDLVDHARHTARHDIRQSYVLGQVFVEALVQRGGPEALPCVLHAIGDSGEQPMAGLALWYGVAARCQVDLDAVLDRYRALLAEARAQYGDTPRLRVAVVEEGGARWVNVRDERELGWMLLCGFRSGEDEPVHRWVFFPADQGRCEVPVAALAGPTPQVQVGYRVPGSRDGLEDVFLEWTDLQR